MPTRRPNSPAESAAATTPLFNGETLDLLADSATSATELSEEEVTKKYISGDVRIVTEQGRTQLPELKAIVDSGRYMLAPQYQRRKRWSDGKQSRLIESILMNVPIPPIYLYEYKYAHYEVMDGVQRLSALSRFYGDELVLTDLEYWKELEGLTYSGLPIALKQGIDRRYLSSIVLLYETARDDEQAQRLKQLVFERINTGGVSLSPQESRNAISSGPLNEKLPKLARNPAFCRAWNIPEPDETELKTGEVREEVLQDGRFEKMEDVEMVLRFFAHRQRTSVGSLRNLKPFLDTYWRRANLNFPPTLVDRIGRLFEDTINLVYGVLGDQAFHIRRARSDERVWVPRPTLLAYDSVMSAFSRHVHNGTVLLARKELVKSGLQELYDNHASDFDGRRTDAQDIRRRDELITMMLNDVVAAA